MIIFIVQNASLQYINKYPENSGLDVFLLSAVKKKTSKRSYKAGPQTGFGVYEYKKK